MNLAGFKARNDHVIVALPEPIRQTDGGLIIPELSKQVYYYGRVISVGEDCRHTIDGEFANYDTIEGAMIIFDKLGSQPLTFDSLSKANMLLVVVREGSIYCTVDEKTVKALGLREPPQESIA